MTAAIALNYLQNVILTGLSGAGIDDADTGKGSDSFIGWRFNKQYPDPLQAESRSIWDVYRLHDADFPRRKLTVPVLFDKKTQRIVSNESAEMIVFFNDAFAA